MVIENAFDPYRKVCYQAPGCRRDEGHYECGGCRGGKVKCGGCGVTDKKLESLCRHYGVLHAGAHDCADDAIATVRLLHKLLAAWPQVASWKLGTLHEHQVTWRREQSDSLREFWKKAGNEDWRNVDSGWPLQSGPVPASASAGAA
jgi:DNA polymerase-3 subunit epsilon